MKLLLVDDQEAFRFALRDLFSTIADVEVVGEASDGAQAIEMAQRLLPDVVLMDIQMPILDGIAATRAIRAHRKDVCVLVLTTFDEDELVASSIRAGAMGYLLKGTPIDEIVEIIRLALRGYTAIGPGATPPGAQGELDESVAEILSRAKRLSEREREVWQWLGEGATNREIANSLGLTEGTVRNYVSTLLATLGVRHRTQAALLWRIAGHLRS